MLCLKVSKQFNSCWSRKLVVYSVVVILILKLSEIKKRKKKFFIIATIYNMIGKGKKWKEKHFHTTEQVKCKYKFFLYTIWVPILALWFLRPFTTSLTLLFNYNSRSIFSYVLLNYILELIWLYTKFYVYFKKYIHFWRNIKNNK